MIHSHDYKKNKYKDIGRYGSTLAGNRKIVPHSIEVFTFYFIAEISDFTKASTIPIMPDDLKRSIVIVDLKSLCLTIIPLMPPWHRLLCTTGISASRHWQSQTNTDDVTIRKSLRYVCSSVYRLFYGLCNEDRNPETGQKQ